MQFPFFILCPGAISTKYFGHPFLPMTIDKKSKIQIEIRIIFLFEINFQEFVAYYEFKKKVFFAETRTQFIAKIGSEYNEKKNWSNVNNNLIFL